MTLRIDSHQHFWRPARGDYGWLDASDPVLAPLVRDFLPADMAPLRAAHGVAQTVLVQAAPSEAETDFLLDLANAHGFIGGVVGWVDLSDPRSARTLERWARHPAFKSVRPMLQDLSDADWIAHAPHPAVVEALIGLGLRFDALVKPQHLPALLYFVQRWPALPVVIDHAAKPALADGWQAPWATNWRLGMAALAQQPQVVCKWSGLLTEAAGDARHEPGAALAMLHPAWDHLLTHFGPQRLMWGSDWPVLTLASDYARWIDLTGTLAADLPADDQAALWHRTATRFYGLPGTA